MTNMFRSRQSATLLRCALTWLSATCALIGALLIGAGSAAAHSGVQSYVYVSLFDDGMVGRVEYPVGDIGEVLGIDFPEDDAAALAVATDNYGDIVAYTAAHLGLTAPDGTPWQLEYADAPRWLGLDQPVGDYLLVPFSITENFSSPPRGWTVSYDGIIESNPERDALFLVEDDWETGIFRNEGEHLLGFSVGDTTHQVVLDDVSVFESLRAIAQRGSTTVDRAPDHVIIVLAALVPAMFFGRRRRNNGGVPTVQTSLVAAAQRISILIAGYSVSLWAIGLVERAPSFRVAGVAVALGVGVAALAGWLPRRLGDLSTFAAGALAGVGLGWVYTHDLLFRSRPLRSLISFHLGAIATIVFVAALAVPVLLLLSRLRVAPLLHVIATGIVAIASAVWVIERAAEVAFSVQTIELQGVRWLTHPIAMAALTVAVGIFVAVRPPGQLRIDTTPSSVGDHSADLTPDSERIETT